MAIGARTGKSITTSVSAAKQKLAQQKAEEDARIAQRDQEIAQAQSDQEFFNQTGMTREQAQAGGGNWDFGGPDWGALTAEELQHGVDAQTEGVRQQVAKQQAAQQTDARYGSDLSWLDPSFQMKPALVGQSQASGAYADPRSIAAQENAYSGMSSLVNTPYEWQSPAQQQGLFDQWGSIAGGAGAPTFQGSGQQQGVFDTMAGLSAPDWTGSGDRQSSAYDEIGNSYQPVYRGEGDQVSAMNAIKSNNSGQQQQWLSAIGANNSSQQQQALGQLQSNNSGQQNEWLRAIKGNSSAQQQGVFDEMDSLYDSGGTQGLDWDDGSRQKTQYDSLQEIIAGGGANKIEMANRAAQRADQEQWLRSQREADQQDYAERGLTGSGQELLSLSADRQAAGSRNSLADLQTAAQLEQRRTDAIGQSSTLAGQMRGQTYQEQALEAQRADQALYAKGDMANNIRGMDLQRDTAGAATAGQIRGLDQQRDIAAGEMTNAIRGLDLQRDVAGGQLSSQIRGLDLQRDTAVGDMANTLRQNAYQEQSFLAQNDLNQAMARGDLATAMRGQNFDEQSYNSSFGLQQQQALGSLSTAMRGQTFDENSYLDTRMTNALGQQTDLASAMRQQQYQEQAFARSDQTNLYGQMGTLGTNMRNSSFNEAYSRGTSADAFTELNANAINRAQAGNVGFLQDSYTNMINQRRQQEQRNLELGLDVSTGLMGLDSRENQYGFSQGTGLAQSDADAFNQAQGTRNGIYLGTSNQNIAGRNAAAELHDQTVADGARFAGSTIDMAGQLGAGGATGGGTSGGSTGGVQPGTLDSVVAGANKYNSYDPWKSGNKVYG